MERRPQENLFRREGEYWTIVYDGVVLRLRDTKGLRYLACLISHPGEPFAARELVQALVEGPGVDNQRPETTNHKLLSDERARLAVTKRIKSAVRKIQEHDPRLGYHFTLTVKTGFQCVYRIDPAQPVAWAT